jgi:hypothetical protein
MKKTWPVWAIICLFAGSILLELITDYSVLITGHALYSNPTFSLIAALSLNLDIIFSAIFIYKLFYLRPDVLLWTNIEFGYSTLRLLYSMTVDAFLGTGTLIANSIEVLVLIVIWWALYHHLKRLLASKKRKRVTAAEGVSAGGARLTVGGTASPLPPSFALGVVLQV